MLLDHEIARTFYNVCNLKLIHHHHEVDYLTHIPVVLSSAGNSPSGATMARSYETLEVTRPAEWVVQVQLNRPEKNNAMNIQTFWR